ncbi:MAG: hypothetical protein COV35_11015 [Alphaproteobacteria bacterium CG11_big_fil_rev_8_21_14_0_20_39_49]|nr:MAG: hypothetical protein COV35_11015 [Alphaproteobacteria bacterium CG11_big_fil_rev_8_21_14_0_20_39_49]
MSDKKNNGEEYSLRESTDELELDDDTISVQSFNTDIFSDDSSVTSLSSGSESGLSTVGFNNRGVEELNLETLRVTGRGMAERLRIIGLAESQSNETGVGVAHEIPSSLSERLISREEGEDSIINHHTIREMQEYGLLVYNMRAYLSEERVPIREGVGGLRDVIPNPDQGGFRNRIGRQSNDIEIRRSDAFDEDEQSLSSDGTNTTPRSPRGGNRSR